VPAFCDLLGQSLVIGAPGGHLTKCLRSKAFKPVPSHYTGVLNSYVNCQLFSYVCTFVCTGISTLSWLLHGGSRGETYL
jgi:hypothetical protein